jgi:hypothetical protein
MHTPGLPATADVKRTGCGDVQLVLFYTASGQVNEVFPGHHAIAIARAMIEAALPGALVSIVDQSASGATLGHPKTMAAS